MDGHRDHSVRELGRLQLRLRDHLEFRPQSSQGDTFYVIEDSLNSKFHRVGLAEYTFISLLDGKTSVLEALRLTAEASPAYAMSEQEAATICKWLVEANLAHTDESARARQLVVAADKTTKTARWRRLNPIMIRLPLFHSDRTFERLLPWLGWCFSLPAACVWLAITGTATFRVATQWDRFVTAAGGILAPGNWLWLLLCWLILKLLHESSHGLVCKKYGGSVREAGVLLILFAPLAYVDVTSAWRFRSKWRRIHTATAGIYVEVLIAAVAALTWAATPQGPLNQICYDVVAMASVMTLLINANPLMRFDGYYILSDLIEIPNLYASGQQYLSYSARRYLLGVKASPPPWCRTRGPLITCYGFASLCWRIVVCAGLAIAASTLLRGAGIVLACAAVAMWVGGPLFRCVRFIDTARKGHGLKLARALIAGGFAATAIVLIIVAPWPGETCAPAVVEYDPLTVVRAGSRGFVRELHVRSGYVVEQGQVLAVLENDELQFELEGLQLEIEQAEVRCRLFTEGQDIASLQAETEYLNSLIKKRREVQSQVDNLIVRAPRSGKIIGRQLGTLLGIFLEEGGEILSIGDEQQKEIVLSVAQSDLDAFKSRVHHDVGVRLKHMQVFTTRLDKVDPRARSKSPHPALCASMGGPVPVKQAADRAGEDERDDYAFLAPRFTGHIKLDAARSSKMRAGQLVTVRIRPFHESIGGHLYRVVANWVDDRFRRELLSSRNM